MKRLWSHPKWHGTSSVAKQFLCSRWAIAIVSAILLTAILVVLSFSSNQIGGWTEQAARWFFEQVAGTAVGVLVGAACVWLITIGKDRRLAYNVKRKVKVEGLSHGATHFAIVIENQLDFLVTVRDVRLFFPSGGTHGLPYLGTDPIAADPMELDGIQPINPPDKPDPHGFATLPSKCEGYWGLTSDFLRNFRHRHFNGGFAMIEYRTPFGRQKTTYLPIPQWITDDITQGLPKQIAHIKDRDKQRIAERKPDPLSNPDCMLIEIRPSNDSPNQRLIFHANHVPMVGDRLGWGNLDRFGGGSPTSMTIREVVHMTYGERIVPCIVCSPDGAPDIQSGTTKSAPSDSSKKLSDETRV